MLAIGVPKPPLALAEDCDFEVGRLPSSAVRSSKLAIETREPARHKRLWLVSRKARTDAVGCFLASKCCSRGEVIVGKLSWEKDWSNRSTRLRARPCSF